MSDKNMDNQKLNVLCLEDSLKDAELIRELLLDAGYEFDMDCVSNEKEFEEILNKQKYDIIISDFSLPGFNAFGALSIAIKAQPNVPFICVSGSIGEETAIELLKQGAVDYVLKDRMMKLASSIQRALDEVKEKKELNIAEKALIESEKRYHRLAEIVPVGIFRTDKDGSTYYVNLRWCEISGMSAEKAMGYGWLDAVHPDDRENVGRIWDEKSTQKQLSYSEYRFLQKNGKISWVMGQAIPEMDSNNECIGFVGTITDITERKIAEMEKERIQNEMRLSEERLNYAMEATTDALWDLNLETGKAYLSPRYYTILDYEPGEFPPVLDSFQKMLHPDDMDNYLKTMEQYLSGKIISHNLELRVRSKKQEWRWILSRGKVVEWNSDKQPIRMVGTHSDISELKRNETDLKRKNRALRILSECNGSLVRLKDEKELANEICKKIHSIGGYPLVWIGLAVDDESKSISPLACVSDEYDDKKFLKVTWSDNELGSGPTGRAIKSGLYSLIRNVKADQDYIYWLSEALKKGYNSVLSLPLIMDNKPIGALTIYSSELNGFDNEEITLLAELASDISYGIMSIRTKEEHNRLSNQLFQSQKSEAIGRLAGGIAHDFNNILTVILGNTEFMGYEIHDTEKTVKHIEQIKNAAEKAASLTRQLLAFSRKEIIQPKVINLNKHVNDMQKMLYRIIGEDIHLNVLLDSNLMNIEADQSHLDQIILNLVVNARDAMPNGGDLCIRTRNYSIDENNIRMFPKARLGCHVVLEVEDNGVGIDKDLILKIFDPFFTTKSSGKGTGLGLSVVEGIVNLNRGWIEVLSELGKGSIFRIYFPAVEININGEITINNEIKILQGNGEKILVIEDEEGIKELASNSLSSNGYKVFDADTISKAFIILEEEEGKLDLVFSDIILPDGSGIDFYEKAILKYPDIKVIFTSGYADEKAKWENIQKNNYMFLPKPYKIYQLLAEIKRILP